MNFKCLIFTTKYRIMIKNGEKRLSWTEAYNMLKNKKVVIFDGDGTLADTIGIWKDY